MCGPATIPTDHLKVRHIQYGSIDQLLSCAVGRRVLNVMAKGLIAVKLSVVMVLVYLMLSLCCTYQHCRLPHVAPLHWPLLVAVKWRTCMTG